MKLKALLLALLIPISSFGANTNVFDSVLIKNNLQITAGSPGVGKFWISDAIGNGAWTAATNAGVFGGNVYTQSNNVYNVGTTQFMQFASVSNNLNVVSNLIVNGSSSLGTNSLTLTNFSGGPIRFMNADSNTNILLMSTSRLTRIYTSNTGGILSLQANGGNGVSLADTSFFGGAIEFAGTWLMTPSGGNAIPTSPQYSFGADRGTGMYRPAASNLAFAVGTVEAWRASTNGLFLATNSLIRSVTIGAPTRLLSSLFFTNGTDSVGAVMKSDGAGNISLGAASASATGITYIQTNLTSGSGPAAAFSWEPCGIFTTTATNGTVDVHGWVGCPTTPVGLMKIECTNDTTVSSMFGPLNAGGSGAIWHGVLQDTLTGTPRTYQMYISLDAGLGQPLSNTWDNVGGPPITNAYKMIIRQFPP